SPLPFRLLLRLAVGIAVLLKRRPAGHPAGQLSAIRRGMELHWRAVWVSLVVFVAACMLNRLDISIRHFSIALALLVLLLAPLPRMLESLQCSNWRGARAGKWVTVGLAAASLATAVRAYPNYFPFLNSLGMG